jgi:hypothetical protein
MKIVYIAGRPHSGSTILDIILGNSSEIVSVGELSSGIKKDDPVCSCDNEIEKCEFWGLVKKEFLNQFPDQWSNLSKATVYWDCFYRIPQILMNSKKIKEYQEQVRCIFSIISQLARKDIVVDSSKEIGRAFFLLKRFPDAKVIHLVRDIDGSIRSKYWRLREERFFRFQWITWTNIQNYFPFLFLFAISWVVGNLLAEVLKLMYRDRIISIKYENLCAEPEKELSLIGEFIGVDLKDVIKSINSHSELMIGHKIGGNRIRNNKSVSFNPQAEKLRDQLPQRYKLIGRFITWPLRIYYGYR